jgi:uncharacterized RDD family membrane protein YckC
VAYPAPPPRHPQTGGYQALPGGYQVPPGYAAAPPYGYRPLPTSPRGEPLADFGARAGARVIDALILGAFSLVLIIPAYILIFAVLLGQANAWSPQTGPGPEFFLTFLGIWAVLFVLLLALQYLYEVEHMLRGGGQTFGKRMMKIRVVPIDPADQLTRRHASLRWLAMVGMSFVGPLQLIDFLFPLWDKPYQQTLHDKAARTVVVRVNA